MSLENYTQRKSILRSAGVQPEQMPH